MKYSIKEEKSLDFAERIVNLSKYLVEQKKEYVISKQIMKSGTSIGANIFEAKQAQTGPDFITKMSISLKEASETIFWLELLYRTNYITEQEYLSLFSDCDELIKMLSSTIITRKKTLNIN